MPAIELSVTRESTNKGKKFWKCGNNSACEFFEWSDAVQAGGGGYGSSNKVVPAKRRVQVCFVPNTSSGSTSS